MMTCVNWRVWNRRGCRVVGVTVFGVEMDVRAAAGSPTVFLLTLHSCGDEYAVHMYVIVAACNSQRLWSCARSCVFVWFCGFVSGLPVRAVAVRCGRGGLVSCDVVTIVVLHVEGEQQQRRRCCVAVACGNLGNFPPAPAVGCPVAVFCNCNCCCRHCNCIRQYMI